MRLLIASIITVGALIKSAPIQDTSYKPLTIPDIVEREAKINDIAPELIHAIIKVESHGNPLAVSKKGARGIMQVMPEHCAYFSLNDGDLFDAEINIMAGTRLLREELNRFGNEYDALRAYNCGSPKAKKHKNCGAQYAEKVMREL